MSDYNRFREIFPDKSTDVDLATGDGGKDNVITVRNVNYKLMIQKISYNPVTAAAQAVVFQDDGAPVKVATVPANQSTPIVFDFGPTGRALTPGKNLDISNVAGPAASIHIEAYERPAVALNANAGASLQ